MMVLKKNILAGKSKINFFFGFIIYFFLFNNLYSENNLEGSFTNIKILDKISSKNTLLKLKNGEVKLEASNRI